MLNITNNKKKSLLKSEIIINLDFVEENINKYKIYNNAIIINISDKIAIQSKRFNGINVSYYKIGIPDEYKMEAFEDEIVYESLIYRKNYKHISKEISKDGIKVNRLIGNNGIIKECEFE